MRSAERLTLPPCLFTDLAAITAAYLTVYYLAGGIGSAIGGGVWTNTVPEKIRTYMNNDTLAATAYANPIGFIASYGVGTPERLAVARAQDEAQVSSGD